MPLAFEGRILVARVCDWVKRMGNLGYCVMEKSDLHR
jgi:hypothetical protein